MIKPKKLKAITLMETLIYLALFAMFFTSIILLTLNIQEGNINANKASSLTKAKMFADQHLSQSFKSTTEIDTTLSTFDTSPGTIRLNLESGYVEYTINSDRLNFFDGSDNNFITPKYITISNFEITRIDYVSGVAVGARIQMTLTDTKNPDLTETIDKIYSIK